jgi:hypothetical protein
MTDQIQLLTSVTELATDKTFETLFIVQNRAQIFREQELIK